MDPNLTAATLLEVRRASDEQALSALEPVWRELFTAAKGAPLFLSFEWMSLWWKHFGTREKLLVLTVWKAERLVGIAPLMLSRRQGARVIEFIGTGRSDYLDFLMADDPRPAIAAILKYLMSIRDEWDLICLRDIPEDSPHLEILEGLALEMGLCFEKDRSTVSPYLPISGTWEEYLATRSRDKRRKIRQNRKRLEEMEGAEVALCTEGLGEDTVRAMVQVEQQSWKQRAGTARLTTPEARAFYADILKTFSRCGWVTLWLVRESQKPIAYKLVFKHNHKMYSYNSAYDLRYSRVSPGSNLTAMALEYAFQHQMAEYDFLRGDEKYKEDWMSGQRGVDDVVLYPPSFRARMWFWVLYKYRWVMRKNERLRQWRFGMVRLRYQLLRYFKGEKS